MRKVRISTIALPLLPEEADVQQEICRRIDMVLPDKQDLILMPEICDRAGTTAKTFRNRDFFGAPEYIRKIARENHCYIAFPTITAPDGRWRNAIVMVDRNGEIMGEYHKVYPTAGEMEITGIVPGRGPVVFDCDFGRVGCIICFDLCYQNLAWEYRELEPDVMLFASAYHGGFVQEIWAYNTISHFVSASSGLQSRILSPVGEVIAKTTNYRDFVTADINLDCCPFFLGLNHGKLNEAKKKYGDKLKISDPGYLGAVLLSCETDEFTVWDIVKEYEMEPLRGYFGRVADIRKNILAQE